MIPIDRDGAAEIEWDGLEVKALGIAKNQSAPLKFGLSEVGVEGAGVHDEEPRGNDGIVLAKNERKATELAICIGSDLPGGEEVGAVVGLDDDDVALAELFADVLRGVAEVSDVGERTARGEQVVGVAGGETEADGFLGVVRDGEGGDLEIAVAEARAGFEELPGGAVSGVEF